MADRPSKEMSDERLDAIRQSPRQASIEDVEDLCAEIDRLRALLAPETSQSIAARSKSSYEGADPCLPAGGAAELTAGGGPIEALRRILGRAGGDWETLDGDDAVEMATIARDALDGLPVETS